MPDYAFSQKAKNSITLIRKIYPEVKIFPWIGGVQNKTVYLERKEWVKNGIHLDLEYVLYSRAKFNYKKLRLALPESFISSVVVSTASSAKPWKHKHTFVEIKEISTLVDQVSFMFYETGRMDLKDYSENLKEQITMIKELKNLPTNRSQYLLGVGIFNEESNLKSYRDLGFKIFP